MLAHRTAVLRHTVKNVRPEGSTVLYVQRLATAFFLQSAEASREFDRCFPGQRDRCSALLMWAEDEVEWFAERLDKQVFNNIITAIHYYPSSSWANRCSTLSRQSLWSPPVLLSFADKLNASYLKGLTCFSCWMQDCKPAWKRCN